MNHRTERDILERQRVAAFDVGLLARFEQIADLDPDGCQDVTLLAVAVMQERDARRPVGIVFDRRNLRRDRIFRALEIDDAILLAVAAALMTHRDVTVEVPARMLLADLDERFLRLLIGELAKIEHRHKALARARRLKLFNSH